MNVLGFTSITIFARNNLGNEPTENGYKVQGLGKWDKRKKRKINFKTVSTFSRYDKVAEPLSLIKVTVKLSQKM